MNRSKRISCYREALKAPAVVQPVTVDEIQQILSVANELKQPVWFNSQGRNNGYGGSATRTPGSIVINLRRMKNIEINLEHGYAVVEPGCIEIELPWFAALGAEDPFVAPDPAPEDDPWK